MRLWEKKKSGGGVVIIIIIFTFPPSPAKWTVSTEMDQALYEPITLATPFVIFIIRCLETLWREAVAQ